VSTVLYSTIQESARNTGRPGRTGAERLDRRHEVVEGGVRIALADGRRRQAVLGGERRLGGLRRVDQLG